MDSDQIDKLDLQRWEDEGGYIPPDPETTEEIPAITPEPQRKAEPEKISWLVEGF